VQIGAGVSDSDIGTGGAGWSVTRGAGRNASQKMMSRISTAATAIIPVRRRSTMRAICEDAPLRR